ncbi:MAG: hypothetical protein RM347_025770 [Nostoc sp. ChiQUE02]
MGHWGASALGGQCPTCTPTEKQLDGALGIGQENFFVHQLFSP